MSERYRLEGPTPVPCSDEEWLNWSERNERDMAKHYFSWGAVFTFFRGADPEAGAGRAPRLFETRQIKERPWPREWDRRCWRYSTWEEAAAGHARIVAKLQAGEEPS